MSPMVHPDYTHLIIHHSIVNTPNQITEFICIVWSVKETLNIPLLGQWFEFLEDIFQFPNSTSLSDPNPNPGR